MLGPRACVGLWYAARQERGREEEGLSFFGRPAFFFRRGAATECPVWCRVFRASRRMKFDAPSGRCRVGSGTLTILDCETEGGVRIGGARHR